ncbi:MAG: ECF transporter S component [Candidatus Avoscillospira sp.]
MKEHETNSLKKTKVLVGMAIFTAIVVVLQLLAGSIKIGPFSPSLVLIPIVIGAATYGAKAGGWLGLVFGIVVLIACITGSDIGGNMMWNFNPLMTAVICLVKGTAAGYLAGLVFRALEKKNQVVATVLAAVVCPVVNTGLFCLGAVAAFRPLLEQWAGGASLVSYIFLGLIGLNFLIELIINVVLSPIVVRILKIRKIA